MCEYIPEDSEEGWEDVGFVCQWGSKSRTLAFIFYYFILLYFFSELGSCGRFEAENNPLLFKF